MIEYVHIKDFINRITAFLLVGDYDAKSYI